MLFNIQKKFLIIPTIISLIFSSNIHAKKSAVLEGDINLDTSHMVSSKLTKISNTQNTHNSKQVMLKVKIGDVKKETTSVLFIPVEKDMNRVFAETTLVALSGNSAYFQSGGEVPVAGPNGLEYKSYGLKISFTPVVTSSSKINLEIYSEVSGLAKNSKFSCSKMPVIESRKAKTTVELGHGESFMVAGLVKDLVDYKSRDNNEIAISVTPYIVHPTKDDNISLPTDKYYRHNNMEIKFIENLNKNSGIASGSDLSPIGPSGLIVE